jgi:predicted RNase H-like nuclease (RuvC/YqgF family)
MNNQTQEALKMAIGIAEKAIKHWKNNIDDLDAKQWEKIDKYEDKLYDLKEALESQEIGDAEIRQMLKDIEYYQKRVEALEQPAQEPVAWMKSAIDNARDVCKYLDHGRINDAMAHTKFFWTDLDKIKEVEDALSNSDTI